MPLQGVSDIIDRCLLKDPDQRPSAEEIFNLIQADLHPGAQLV